MWPSSTCLLSPTSPKSPTPSFCPPTLVTSAEWSHRYLFFLNFYLNSHEMNIPFVIFNTTVMFFRLWLFTARWQRRAQKQRRKRWWGWRRRAKRLRTSRHHLNSRGLCEWTQSRKKWHRRSSLCFSYQSSKASVCERSSLTLYWQDSGEKLSKLLGCFVTESSEKSHLFARGFLIFTDYCLFYAQLLSDWEIYHQLLAKYTVPVTLAGWNKLRS